MGIPLDRVKAVWEEALSMQHEKTNLLEYVRNNADVLYLWILKMNIAEPESCAVKMIERLDDPFRDDSDHLLPGYQPIVVDLTPEEILNLGNDPLFPSKYEKW